MILSIRLGYISPENRKFLRRNALRTFSSARCVAAPEQRLQSGNEWRAPCLCPRKATTAFASGRCQPCKSFIVPHFHMSLSFLFLAIIGSFLPLEISEVDFFSSATMPLLWLESLVCTEVPNMSLNRLYNHQYHTRFAFFTRGMGSRIL